MILTITKVEVRATTDIVHWTKITHEMTLEKSFVYLVFEKENFKTFDMRYIEGVSNELT